MIRGFLAAVAAVVLFGTVAAIAYQAGLAASATAGGPATIPVAYYWHPFFGFGLPFFGLLFPILFLFLVFGLVRAASGGRWSWHGERRRMLEEWHREMHERRGAGTDEQH